MGRRKIEIKPIRDDRNRSVTFLKRKGGLFKKAHELSVLCQVDVAVIIFGHNKKLYEYSSSDINDVIGRFQYYGGAHEHKGPQDFADKGGDDDDDEDDVGDEGDQRGTPQPDVHMGGMQHHPSFQHVRQGTPQQSPPMHNGQMPPFQRGPSPLPQNLSRPSSRAEQHQGHFRRASSNLVPPQHAQQAQMAPQNYAYQPNPQFQHPQAAAQMQRPPGYPGPPPQGSTYPPPYQSQAQHPQMQQVMLQDARRSSMPPAFAPQPPPQANMQRQDHLQTPPQPQPQRSPRVQQLQGATPSPQPPHQQFASPPVPQPRPLPAHAKTQSMFTPIDDSRSMLAQHWGSTSNAEPPRSELPIKQESGARSASVDTAAMEREKVGLPAKANGVPSPARRAINRSPNTPQRTASMPTARGPQRVVAGQAEPKRPRLKVQIPSEQSGDEGGTASAPDETSTSQPRESGSNDPSVNTNSKPTHGVVLPPPSPSTNALLSAGAQGPPNPFARPAPPMSTNPHAMNRDAAPTNNNIETPISALPSRFMSDNLLPSPSTFYPEWGFGRGGGGGTDSASNMLPSPLNFQTPVLPMGGSGSWRDESSSNGKRAGEGGDESEAKRTKT